MRLSERARGLLVSGMSADNSLRVDQDPESNSYTVWSRVSDLDQWLAERQLPVQGGTIAPANPFGK